jgi:putative ABC transport system permease protein
VVQASTSQQTFSMKLLGVFAGMALLLAAIGIYGVVSYMVEQRTAEIGIRMALGARPAQVMRLVAGQGLMLAGLGIAAGLAGAFGLTRLMQGMLYGVKPGDPLTYAAAGLGLLAVAAAACLVPARRAMRVDPAIVLRQE